MGLDNSNPWSALDTVAGMTADELFVHSIRPHTSPKAVRTQKLIDESRLFWRVWLIKTNIKY